MSSNRQNRNDTKENCQQKILDVEEEFGNHKKTMRGKEFNKQNTTNKETRTENKIPHL